MLTIKTVNKENDVSVFQCTGDVSFNKSTRTLFFRGWAGGDDDLLLDEGESAYVCNEKGVTVAIFN